MHEEHGDLEPLIDPATQLELDSVVWRRAVALQRPVVAVTFATSGAARLLDVTPDGELLDAGTFQVAATPPAD